MESEQLFNRGYGRNSYNSITSASSDEELLDGAGIVMDFHTTEDDNLLDGDTSPGTAGPHLLLTYRLGYDLRCFWLNKMDFLGSLMFLFSDSATFLVRMLIVGLIVS